jgi:hypothetical protein
VSWKTVPNNGISLQFPGGGTDSLRVVFDPFGHDIAYVVPSGPDDGNGNASLIAAAPDLLAACKRIWDAVVDARYELPDELLLAAFDCRRATVRAVSGNQCSANPEEWLVRQRREQNRARQQRCRARKKAAQEPNDGR